MHQSKKSVTTDREVSKSATFPEDGHAQETDRRDETLVCLSAYTMFNTSVTELAPVTELVSSVDMMNE